MRSMRSMLAMRSALPNLAVLDQGGDAPRRRGLATAPGLRPWGGPAQRDRAVLRSIGTADLTAAFVVAFAGS
jgi:hypothetical protein